MKKTLIAVMLVASFALLTGCDESNSERSRRQTTMYGADKRLSPDIKGEMVIAVLLVSGLALMRRRKLLP